MLMKWERPRNKIKKQNKWDLRDDYLKTCFGSLESVGVVDGLALRSSGCSVFRSTGLGDGFAPGLSADVDSVVVVAFVLCIRCITGL